VYTWGVNDNFALGRKVEENEEHLVKKMEAPAATDSEARNRLDPGFMRNVMQVRMGDSHTLVLTIDGKVYSTGIYKDVSICRRGGLSFRIVSPLFCAAYCLGWFLSYHLEFVDRTQESGGTCRRLNIRCGSISITSRKKSKQQTLMW
jgi:alpha-tubulin suppressor-like RCC1 family protein